MRRHVTVMVLALVVAACGDSAETGSAAPATTLPATSATSTPAQTTSAATTTIPERTTAPATTATTEPSVPTTTVNSLFPPDPFAGSEGAAGSGCAPGTDDLPDGAWFGRAVGWDRTGIDFDLACFYFGEEAYRIGEELGEEINNDYIIVNDSNRLRRIPVTATTPAFRIRITGEVTTEATTYAEMLADPGGYVPCPGEFCSVWLFVTEGEVTAVLQQYLP